MIHVVDYGAGNIGSVLNMIKRVGCEALPTGDARVLSAATKILLPGVGSFDNAVQKLQSLGLIDVLRERAAAGIPFLGICLGMQLLASGSEEGVLPGLDLISGTVRKFSLDASQTSLKIPHMGWNLIRKMKASRLTAGLDDKARFYFVHSYHYECIDAADRLLETHHGYAFTSGVERGNVMGVQFHPEKSHRYGMQLIKNFVEL
ncbi:imidazole glycerol phosphate synthase subunit HisH [Rhodoferax sp.]|uniref:imidazole glycerol phosphate synthase subunit HisH n=1 Tax=Rhodoferax sp. TaxID=50421 RepID=UPI00272F6E70|nr:imidazole glycerol phosphate synthase subunit HisH [Rhodoferax sp.]MDP2440557.1 imidazole glycerol phosphate synthase subunit HisH [Rhodoferax sp.]MDZ4208666.1 imidazole glycerol phosphate synthase subunit HisH [Rhodoferax sp.]